MAKVSLNAKQLQRRRDELADLKSFPIGPGRYADFFAKAVDFERKWRPSSTAGSKKHAAKRPLGVVAPGTREQ